MEQIDDKADLFVGRHVSVSRETAEVFGRPAGVRGSFADSGQSDSRPAPAIRPPDPVLAEAFSRPAGEPDSLQRDPLASYGVPDEPPARADPWRDPDSTPTLDRPALSVPVAPEPTLAGPKLGVREVLFGNRISWWALGTLAMIALLIGLVGGLLGRWTAEVAAPLHSNSVKLHQSGGGGDQPRSQVAARVARVPSDTAPSLPPVR